ncbi:restriction endonuclease subunit S [Schaalia sp. ORNL0103]|uniref:restriction endonuclease subunit S n=1 Tax=Schaalia sp. ORNL0103 TaxID=2789426 RepID=UPI001CA47BBA|nr:restriction endonuclease subunit S [Schaalia sp. ORNL0103]MBW6412981.1 restriction endonuclease subunit S [Schaalia sp. ORNL0103]
MSRLAELIEELCPDGVEYRALGDVAELKRGQAVTRKEIVEGQVPVIAGGREPAYYIDRPNRQGETIVIAGSGAYAGFVSFWNEPIFVSDAFSIVVDRGTLQPRFVYHWLRGRQETIHALKSGGGVPHVYPKDVAKLRCPIPPLEVQREIVRILDQFTTLEAELEVELEARQAQYEHYRNHLLSYESLAARGPVEMLKLGELAHIATGGRNTSDAVENGTYPFYVRSQVPLSLNEYDFDESAVLTAGDGVGVGKVFHHVEGKYALHQRAYRLVPNLELLSSRYLYHVMVSQFGRYLESTVFHSSVTSVRKPMLERFPVAVPPMEEQDRVADVLDRFNALVNDITSGLPAEIAARRAQYEHYRDRLLSFPEKKAE